MGGLTEGGVVDLLTAQEAEARVLEVVQRPGHVDVHPGWGRVGWGSIRGGGQKMPKKKGMGQKNAEQKGTHVRAREGVHGLPC